MKPQFDADESLGSANQRYRNVYLSGLLSTPVSGGASAAYAKTAAGVLTLLAANTDFARDVAIIVTVDEVFANGTGAQTTFKIGTTSSDAVFAATSVFTGAALGRAFTFSGSVKAGDQVIVTATAATSNGTGGISVTVVSLRAYYGS